MLYKVGTEHPHLISLTSVEEILRVSELDDEYFDFGTSGERTVVSKQSEFRDHLVSCEGLRLV